MSSEVIEFLKQNGPSTADKLPSKPSIFDKMNGVWDLDLNAGSKGSRIRIGKTSKIYYLKGYHSKADVVRAWIDENPSVLEKGEVGVINFFNGQGSAWGRVAKYVLRNDYEGEYNTSYNNEYDGNPHTGTWNPSQEWAENV